MKLTRLHLGSLHATACEVAHVRRTRSSGNSVPWVTGVPTPWVSSLELPGRAARSRGRTSTGEFQSIHGILSGTFFLRSEMPAQLLLLSTCGEPEESSGKATKQVRLGGGQFLQGIRRSHAHERIAVFEQGNEPRRKFWMLMRLLKQSGNAAYRTSIAAAEFPPKGGR